MFYDDYSRPKRNNKKVRKQKIKIRDRYGKAIKNKLLEQESIEKMEDGYNDLIDFE